MQGPEFNPWLGKLRSQKSCDAAKKFKKESAAQKQKFKNYIFRENVLTTVQVGKIMKCGVQLKAQFQQYWLSHTKGKISGLTAARFKSQLCL